MNDSKLEEKIYSSLTGDRIADPEIIEMEGKIQDLYEEMELMIPPDQYEAYMGIILKHEDLRHKRDFLNFQKIYKGAFKEGLLTGLDLDV